MRISLARKFTLKEILLAVAVALVFAFLFFVEYADALMYFRSGQIQEGFADFGKHYLVTISTFLFFLFAVDLNGNKSYMFEWVCLSGVSLSLILTILIRQSDLIWQVAVIFGITLLIFLFRVFKIEKSKQSEPISVPCKVE